MNKTNKWWALIGISILFMCAGIDFTIVSTALPTIQAKLNLSLIQLQWVMNIYLLFNCIFLAAMGYLGDLYGRRLMLYLCITLFVLSTLISGLANSGFWLTFGRGIQGLVEAILMPCSLGLISAIFPQKERGRAIGIWGSFVGIGMIIGSGLGGFIVSSYGWRGAFFVKLPILFIAFVTILFTVPESRSKMQRTPFDWVGFSSLSFAIGCLIVSIIHGTEWGWTSTLTLCLLAIAIILFYFFYAVERKIKNPLMPLSLFSNRTFVACAATQFVSVVFVATALFLIPLYLQNIHNIPVAMMGLLIMIMPLSMLVFSLLAGYTMAKLKIKTAILLGLLPLILSALLQMFFGVNTTIILLTLAFVLFGASWGWILSTTTTAALNTIAADFMSVSIGILWTIQIAGGAIGLAISGALFRYQDKVSLLNHLSAAHITLSPDQQQLIRSLLSEPEHAKQILNQLGITASEKVLPLFTKAFLHGYVSAMLLMLILGLLCLLFNFFMIEEKA